MTDRPILGLFNRLLAAALLIATIAAFIVVPLHLDLPIHWGPDGQADRFAPAPVALLLPLAMAALVVGLLFVLRPAGLQKDFEAGRHLIAAVVSFILILALVILTATVALGLGQAVDMPRLVALLVGGMLLVVGNYLPKTQPNWIAGIRLPWTLRDPANWRVTHRWTGRLMMLGGGVTVMAAILVPAPGVLITAVVAAAVIPALVGVLISYRLARSQPE